MRILLSTSTVTISHKARLLQQLDEIDHARKQLLYKYHGVVAKLNDQLAAAKQKCDADLVELNIKATALTAALNKST